MFYIQFKIRKVPGHDQFSLVAAKCWGARQSIKTEPYLYSQFGYPVSFLFSKEHSYLEK